MGKQQVLVSIVVSIPACHAGDRGSIPRRGGYVFCSTCWTCLGIYFLQKTLHSWLSRSKSSVHVDSAKQLACFVYILLPFKITRPWVGSNHQPFG